MGKSHSLGQLTQKKKVYDLPESVKELEKIVGLGVLDIVELLKHFGGAYLDVPKNPDKAQQLAAVMSREGVEKLCAYYGGSRIAYLPKWESTYLRIAKAGCIYYACKTQPKREVARRHGVSIQFVHETCRRWEAEVVANYKPSVHS
ncbi:MAG: hypothetical protein E6Q84_02260 [Thiothrix sp.]|nr:MAG: hypothetical protein E6Q84_02260 [Thiothrix sp.]